VSLFLFGGIIGALNGGHLATKLGRRRLLLLNNINFILAGIILSLAPSVWFLYVGRIFAGMGAGFGSVGVPLYLAEISPVDIRGSVGSLNQLAIVVGILVSQTIGIPLSTRYISLLFESKRLLTRQCSEGWRLLFGLTIVPSILQALLTPFCVESPKYNNILMPPKKRIP
jgi:MFS family permease